MAFNIQHTYCTHVNITFDDDFEVSTCGSMDEIQEAVMLDMVKHNFTHADICDASTGEVLMVVDRT